MNIEELEKQNEILRQRVVEINFNDIDFEKLEKLKGDKSWRNFIEELTREGKELALENRREMEKLK